MFSVRFLSIMLVIVLVTFISPFQSFAGNEVRAGSLLLQQPWARATIGKLRPGAAYLTIINKGKVDDTLVSISTPVSGRAELHLSTMEGGIMKMLPASFILIKAGKTVKLAPGGWHIMLMELKKPLNQGDSFPLTFCSKQAGKVTIKMHVAGPGASQPPK